MKHTLIIATLLGVAATPLTAQPAGVPPTPQPPAKVEAPQDKEKASQEQTPAASTFGYEPGGKVDGSISLTDLDGRQHMLSDYAGKIVLIDFWSITCPISKGYEEAFKSLHDEYAKQGVVFLMIDPNHTELDAKNEADPYHKIRAYVKEHAIPYPILIDHDNVVADKMKAKTTPHIYLVDKKGVVRYTGAVDEEMAAGGAGSDGKPYVRQAIDALLSDREVPVKSTTPRGCPIKRVSKKSIDATGTKKGEDATPKGDDGKR